MKAFKDNRLVYLPQLNSWGYADFTEIPANADLNTAEYTAVGNYVCSGDSITSTLINCPSSLAFKMEVSNVLSEQAGVPSTSAGPYRLRKIISYNDGSEWVQHVRASSGGTISYGT